MELNTLRSTNVQVMIEFNKHYFSIAILIFVVEVLIAIFVTDRFVRPYLGDVLVVILIYCFIQSFFKLPVFTLAMSVLVFAFSVELLQYFHIVEVLGLEKSKISRTIIGTSFEWIDLLAYAGGVAVVVLMERYLMKKRLFL